MTSVLYVTFMHAFLSTACFEMVNILASNFFQNEKISAKRDALMIIKLKKSWVQLNNLYVSSDDFCNRGIRY